MCDQVQVASSICSMCSHRASPHSFSATSLPGKQKGGDVCPHTRVSIDAPTAEFNSYSIRTMTSTFSQWILRVIWPMRIVHPLPSFWPFGTLAVLRALGSPLPGSRCLLNKGRVSFCPL